MARVLRSPLFAAVLASLLTASLFGIFQVAQAGSNAVYTGCMKKGELYNVRRGHNPLSPCDKPSHQITWNAQGQPGPEGSQGPPGRASTVLCAGCDLFAVVLPGANLPGAYMVAANLTSATLTDAYLRDAILINVDFIGADLTDADMKNAELMFADLTNADLDDANLAGANLLSATLQGTDLINVRVTGTDFTSADLTNADLTNAVGIPLTTNFVTWSNTICPNGVNSDANGGTCDGTFS